MYVLVCDLNGLRLLIEFEYIGRYIKVDRFLVMLIILSYLNYILVYVLNYLILNCNLYNKLVFLYII